MGLFNRKKSQEEEQRSINVLPWNYGGPRPSYVTTQNAASLVPVFASMRILADNIASLPIEVFRKQQGDLTPQSFTPPLFYKPSARDNTFQWIHKCVVSLVLRGNAYGVIVARDKLGFATQVEWLFPDDVWVDETKPATPRFFHMGQEIDPSDVVHIPWIVQPGRVVGLSPVQAFANTMGVGLAAAEYGRRWFDNGGSPPSMLKNSTKTINPDESKGIQSRAVQSISTGKPLVLGSDWDFTQISVTAEESQFLATMRLNATQIAAIYGVPASLVAGETGGSLTYSTVEGEINNLIVLTLRPWIVRLEAAFSGLLANVEEIRFNVDALIRTSVTERYDNYATALDWGWLNVDEVRARENLPPLPNGLGKVYRVPADKPTPAPKNPAKVPHAKPSVSDAADATETPPEGVTE